MTAEEILETAMDIGEEMLLCGAEVARVEDSFCRICAAYEVDRVDVFCITSSLYATVNKDGESFTQTRRIHDYAVNLQRLDSCNNLSRNICTNKPSREEVISALAHIKRQPQRNLPTICLFSAMAASSFAIMFGGDLMDGLVAGILGVILRLILTGLKRFHANMIFINVVTSAIIGILASWSVWLGFGNQLDKIIIGNIMLLIPGLLLVNAVRDMIERDMMAGMLRLCEAIILSLAIAIGFGLAATIMGGLFI